MLVFTMFTPGERSFTEAKKTLGYTQLQIRGQYVPTEKKVRASFCNEIRLYIVSSGGVTIIDWRSQCCDCQSDHRQHVLGTRAGKMRTDGMISFGYLRPTAPHPPARCLHQSVTLPFSVLDALCLLRSVSCAVWVNHNHVGLSNRLPFRQKMFPFW